MPERNGSSRPGYVDRRQVLYHIEPTRLGQIAARLAGAEVGRTFTLPLGDCSDTDYGSA